MDKYVLVLYYSVHDNTKQMAQQIARGVAEANLDARLRTVPAVSPTSEATTTPIPDSGAPYATYDDLKHCSGLIVGSPTRFGNMAAAMKYFLDGSTSLWLSGGLADKPAGVFTSTGSLHGGQESTLLSMMLPLFHHGMVLVGVPPTTTQLYSTQSGGTPYGPSHVAGMESDNPLTEDEKKIAQTLGKRVASFAAQLNQ